VPFEFEISDPADSKTKVKVTEKWLAEEAGKIRREYFIPLGSSSYGNLILKRRKNDFQQAVARLSVLMQSYAGEVAKSIAAEIKGTRESLVKALYPILKESPPADWAKHSIDGNLNDDDVRRRLDREIGQAFERVQESFSPRVTCIFKGVQYETITQDKHFRERIEKYFGQKDAAHLLSEYDASRAQDPFPK
jgi:hypothetical protein